MEGQDPVSPPQAYHLIGTLGVVLCLVATLLAPGMPARAGGRVVDRHGPVTQRRRDAAAVGGPGDGLDVAGAVLDQEIVLVGLYHRIELWNPAEWRRYITKTEDSYEQHLGKILNLL